MATQGDSKSKKKTARGKVKAKGEEEPALDLTTEDEGAGIQAEEALTEAKDALAAAQEEIDKESRARAKAEKKLNEAREALSASQAEVDQERQTRVVAEKALSAEAAKTLEAEAESKGPPPLAPGEDGVEQRFSFIVRLTVGEQGKPRRTEVEHAMSGKKEAFPDLDVQKLAAFMEACIAQSMVTEPTIARSMSVLDVLVLRPGALGVAALTLSPAEAFLVQARFRLQGSEASSITAQESSYEIKVFAREETSRKSRLLNSYVAKLIRDKLEYTDQIEVPGLSPGLYRLLTVVTLKEPINMVDHFERPIINVGGAQLDVKPASPLKVPHSQ